MKLFYETAVNGVVIAAIYAVLASTLAFLFRVSRQLNLAHGDIMIVGAYVGYFVAQAGGGLAVAILGGLAAGAVVGAAVYFGVFRWLLGTRGHIYLVGGVALSALIEEILNITVNGGNAVTFPARLVGGGGLNLGFDGLLVGVTVVMTGTLHVVLRKTRLGRSLRATSEDWTMAQLLGVNVGRNVLASYVIASALVGGAGVLFGVSSESINPLLGSTQELVALAIVLVGGLGEVANAGYVAIIMGLAITFLSTYVSSVFGTALAYVVLILVVVAKPTRLLQEARA